MQKAYMLRMWVLWILWVLHLQPDSVRALDLGRAGEQHGALQKNGA